MKMDDPLAQAKTGSVPAFEALVRQHGSLVFSIGFHFLANAALAEEVSQEIFLELYRGMQKIQSEEHLVSWLRRSTANRCIDISRRKAYRSEVSMPETFHPASAGTMSDPLLEESLRRQVAALPEWQRAVVVLRYQEDMNPDEISRALSIPINTVKSRLYRALETLRERLERKKVKS